MKNILIWLLSLIITISFAIYQRLTGPTYPVSFKYSDNLSTNRTKLLRSATCGKNNVIEFPISDTTLTGKIKWKRYKSYDEWQETNLEKKENKLIWTIPEQPPAGKIVYQVTLIKNDKIIASTDEVILRFKGDVPLFFLIPHVILMFLGMLFSIRSGIEAIINGTYIFKYSQLTLITLIIGGLIFGPIIQYHAFNAFWTGWPFGHDLTDNKTAVAIILWLLAYFKLKKDKSNKKWAIIAAIGTIIIYLIPHSLLGSEIDYTKIDN